MKSTFLLFLSFFQIYFFNASAQTIKKVELLHADYLEFDEAISGEYKRLIGNVQFMHEGAFMDCDSAHFFSEQNYLEAFSRVHIRKGDSLNLYGDTLIYQGNTKKAQLYGNIRLTDKSMTLYTSRLDYDMNLEIANYKTGGRIVDKENVLTSKIGDYFSLKNEVHFKDHVMLVNPDYIILCDTMRYNTITKVAYFHGPTTITGDEMFIFCNYGWYDTEKETSNFSRSAEICTNEQELRGDSILHDQGKGISIVFGNMILIDTLKDLIIRGDYGYRSNELDSSFVTGQALMIQIMDGDSLFLHGDTLVSIPDSISKAKMLLSTEKLPSDSISTLVKAYHHVKIFKTDLQGKCDSMIYLLKDSILHFYVDPVMWSKENQLTAEIISMQMANDRMDKMFLKRSAFIIAEQDTARFNQIKGNDMIGFFEENELSKIDVQGNGQTIYYALDSKAKYIGVNKAEGANIMIYMKDSEVNRIHLKDKPEAIFYPMNELSSKELQLKDFRLRNAERPKEKKDIFVW